MNNYPVCGKCLHATTSHEKHNGKFMHCAVCFRLCELDEFEYVNKPTHISKIMEIAVKKQ